MAMLYCTFTVGNHANWRRSRLATRPRLRALDARGAVHLASARRRVNILEHNRPLRPHKTVKALWNKSIGCQDRLRKVCKPYDSRGIF
ncbi:hypothetical protein OH76DRAFT_1402649 [Lentinus brumalis]|uniref:Uncharacterized protein n=1 Tax=Lentinus brumalis TaxID=2498619 RepID=A0A371DDF8_9APHY|nr:hypothetical protein OH76DRAFT_1402649 [Polyporus brumalis]